MVEEISLDYKELNEIIVQNRSKQKHKRYLDISR